MNRLGSMLDALSKRVMARNGRVLLFFLVGGILLKLVYLLASRAWMNDEFLYLEGGRRILEGQVLYRDFADIKPPLVFFLYAAIASLFGYAKALWGIKLVNILVQTLAGYAFFRFTEKFAGRSRAFLAGSLFIAALASDAASWPLNVMTLSLPPFGAYLYFMACDGFQWKARHLAAAGLSLGVAVLFTTNFAVFLAALPLLLLTSGRRPRLGEFLGKNIVFGLAFLVPAGACAAYFALRGALADWYFWNIHWAGYYAAERSLLAKIPGAFLTLFRSWQWAPLYVLGILGLIAFFRNRSRFEKPAFIFLTIFLGLTVLARLPLGRMNPRYNPYILPVFVVFLAFADFQRLGKRFVRACVLFGVAAYIANGAWAAVFPFDRGLTERREVSAWLAENTPPDEKIFVWYEGYEFYFAADRDMATAFFSCGQHLDYPPIYKKMKDRDIDLLWDKFFAQLRRDRPLHILDMSGNFSRFNEAARPAKLARRMADFRAYVAEHYELARDFSPLRFRYSNSYADTFDSIKAYRRKDAPSD
ncbi:MAG: glycosyltransferase family 39 protein [Acidobacteriota bacterium]